MATAGAIACIFFTATSLPSLLIVAPAAAAGPLIALFMRPESRHDGMVAWGAVAFAVALCLAYAASRENPSEIDYRPVARATALDGGHARDDDDDFRRRHGGAFANHDTGRAGFNRSKGCW